MFSVSLLGKENTPGALPMVRFFFIFPLIATALIISIISRITITIINYYYYSYHYYYYYCADYFMLVPLTLALEHL